MSDNPSNEPSDNLDGSGFTIQFTDGQVIHIDCEPELVTSMIETLKEPYPDAVFTKN